MTVNTGAIGWDTPIEEDAHEFELIPAGTYEFKVKLFEQARFMPKPGGKIPIECPQANLQLEIIHDDVTYIVFDQLILYESTMGFVAEFFAGIGQKKKGVPLQPNWGAVTGSTGTVVIKHETYQGVTRAKVSKYISAEEAAGSLKTAPQTW